mmetsp:Transcript_142084/g.345172  ORF Transcript_142084/g.345172 Transcript_142084/m.345172 type:complete len:590 (-) Transcript_142084:94-1863(-)
MQRYGMALVPIFAFAAVHMALADSACVPTADGTCTADEADTAALLAHRVQPHAAERSRRKGCPGDDVKCPGSNVHCCGNQCCPGFKGSMNKSFPCPTANRKWNKCEGTLTPPTPMPTPTTAPHVRCPGTRTMCSGNQCCPGFTGTANKTFPCPSADDGWNHCETEYFPNDQCKSAWETPIECLKKELYSNGVLVHGMGQGEVIVEAYNNAGALDWNSLEDGKKWVMDCAQGNSLAETKNYGITYCSAWSFLQNGAVPMVYNYPAPGDGAQQHVVGLAIQSGQQFAQGLVRRMFVVDGYTLGRGGNQGQGGVSASDVDAWKAACPGWPNDPIDTPLYCVFRSADGDWNSCNYNTNPPQFEIPVGENGESWADIFMYKDGTPLMSAAHTNERQCQFKPEDFDKWRSSLESMYDKMKYQMIDAPEPAGPTYPQDWAWPLPNNPSHPDDQLYLETELVMETEGNTLMDQFKSDQSLLAVFVATNPLCTTAMAWNSDKNQYNSKIKTTEEVCNDAYAGEDDCGGGDIEQCQIQKSIDAACRIADQLTQEGFLGGNKVPVVKAAFPTNSVPDAEQWERQRADEYGQSTFFEVINC